MTNTTQQNKPHPSNTPNSVPRVQSSGQTPYPHAETIKAWADGAIIQFWSSRHNNWCDVIGNDPTWSSSEQYRVKPKPKVKMYLVAYKCSVWHRWMMTTGYYNKSTDEYGQLHPHMQEYHYFEPSEIEVEE